MLKRLFHWEFPPLKHSYWLGINWGENAVAVYFGTAVFLFMSFVGIINFEPGLIFILIITVGFSLLLLAGIFEEISNPVRVDFDENQIQFIHLISRPKTVKITSLSEIRVETILKKPPANSKSKPQAFDQIAFEISPQKIVFVKRGSNRITYANLVQGLLQISGVPVFVNKTLQLVSPRSFGSGAIIEFDEFLKGDTAVSAHSVHEIIDFLISCQYALDMDLFKKPDHWQLPLEFEELKKGDCEDHALWAWHKLHKLGIPSEFIVGTMYNERQKRWNGHAWLTINQKGRLQLFETVRKSGSLIQPLDDVKHKYRPYVGIDHHLRTFSYQRKKRA